jgi:hypothetical protein
MLFDYSQGFKDGYEKLIKEFYKLSPEECRNQIYTAAIKDLFSKKESEIMSNPEQIKHVECQCGQCIPGENPFLDPKYKARLEQCKSGTDAAKPTTDNWIHRSSGMLCKTCMWYVPKGSEKGRCRRHAPTLGGWPVLFPTDWCGDHKLA